MVPEIILMEVFFSSVLRAERQKASSIMVSPSSVVPPDD